MITKEQVIKAQNQWAQGVIEIGTAKDDNACKKCAMDFLDDLYFFEIGPVLFKPTMASSQQFRSSIEMALSYFIGGENTCCKEDDGFAKKSWTDIKFENHNIILDSNRAIAMGNYYFKSNDSNAIKVEYTFGYKLVNGKLKIDLHHSSLPYSSDS
ncbi:MAG: hypothetical protein EVA44_04010 [Flavobacteriales bacterium]|jgi:hypothetical protein|nr:hypothetical protein [Flavobacteriaceae bacterium]RZP05983.1 MAG: hypothetical protein EVA44_04010 [Flavobacteriales bacterium]|tara:strand:+ start:393 stop:857 length:465 start_codon:yes stop_codon:yes gene_type:complete